MRFVAVVLSSLLLAVAGCGSDDGAGDEQAATTPASGGTPATTTAEGSPTTTAADARRDRLSPEGRAVLDATQDLAVDVSDTADELARGRIDEAEAMARLELAGERADDLRRRAEELPAAERAREELASLNAEVTRTADELARLVSDGRARNAEDIEKRLSGLRREAQSTIDAIGRQLDERTQKRLREAFDRIGAETSR